MKRAAAICLSLTLLLAAAGCGRGLRVTPEEPEIPGTIIPQEPQMGGGANPDRTQAEAREDAPALQDPAPAPEPDPEPAPETENTTITLSFAGDVLIAQLLNQYSEGGFNDYAQTHEPSYFLEGVEDWFATDDFTVVNLENVLSDQDLEPRDKGQGTAYWYRAPTSYTDILTAGSVEAVSVANNHTHDYGEEGYQDTIRAARDAGLSVGSNEETVYLEKNGFTVAVICNGLWNENQGKTIASRVRAAQEQSDFQIVVYHGGTEGVHEPEDWKIRASRSLVDAGADVVLGGHPHVLQPMESYNGVDILYSLGNFCYGGNWHPENRTVIYRLRLTVSPEGELVDKTSELIPCYVYTGDINNFQPAAITDESERQLVLDFLSGQAESPL